jgi:hypothetical protein
MKRFEVCVLYKEYRWLEIEAEDEEQAKEAVWDRVACGFTGDVKADDVDTEIYIERELAEGEEI